MKVICFLCACSMVGVVPRALSQGTIIFRNVGAPVTLPDGGAPGNAFTAGLFLVSPNGLNLLGTTGFFGTGSLVPLWLTVPGVPPSAPATFRARVWETDAGSYENAVAAGKLYGEFQAVTGGSNILVPHLGKSMNDPTPSGVPELSEFILPLQIVPEPGSLDLALLGGAVLAGASLLPRRNGRRS